jgi:hypothetical protein
MTLDMSLHCHSYTQVTGTLGNWYVCGREARLGKLGQGIEERVCGFSMY